MYYQKLRYFTRPALIAADQERKNAGIPDRHHHPAYRKLPKKGIFVVKCAFPHLHGQGDGIPQIHCFILWPEGGLAWDMDITVERYKQLPQFISENPHAYRL